MNKKKVAIFLATTFGLTWSSWWLLAFLKQDDLQISQNILFFFLMGIGGLSPTISAYVALKFSDKEYKVFNKSVIKWRVNYQYYLFSILVLVGVRYLSIYIYGLFFEPIWSELKPEFFALFILLPIMIPSGGLEELGWRGLLFPELSKRFKFFTSALLVSLIWALWHLPLFFVDGLPNYHSDLLEFAIQVLGLGLVLAWLYKRTKSIFICIFFHALQNSISSIGLDCPKDGRYIMAFILLLIGGILWIIETAKNRKKQKLIGG